MVRAGLLASLVGICFGACWGIPVVHHEFTEEQVPEPMAREICESMIVPPASLGIDFEEPCCKEPPFESFEQCNELVVALWIASRDAAVEAGLVLSGSCIETLAGK